MFISSRVAPALVFVTGLLQLYHPWRGPARVHPGRPKGSRTTISVSALYGRGHSLLRSWEVTCEHYSAPERNQTGFGNLTKLYGLLLYWRSLPLGKAPSSKTTMRMRIGPNSSLTSKGNRRDVLGSVLARFYQNKHLWDDLRSNHAPTATLARLVQILLMEWNAVRQASLRNLVQPIRRRCEACIQARGGYTQF